MFKYLRIGVSALALSAFMVTPVITVITADYAYAKNDNGKGNGKGNGGDKGGDRGADKGNKGKGNDKASKSRSVNNGNKTTGKNSNKANGFAKSVKSDFKSLQRSVKQHGIAGLFKSKIRQQRTTRAISTTPTKHAPKASTRPEHRAVSKHKGALHPSNLGKLNGAINSSPRAKEAHIANGQYMKGTGPVSLAAALAVADYGLALAREDYVKDLADAVDTLDLANDLADAQEIVDAGSPTTEEVDEAQSVLEDEQATEEDKAAAQDTIDAASAFADAEAFIEDNPAPSDEEIAEANNVIDAGPPSEEDVIAAEENLLNHYKGEFSETEKIATLQQEAVLEAVRDSNPTDDAIKSALGDEDVATPLHDENGEDVADKDDVKYDATDQG